MNGHRPNYVTVDEAAIEFQGAMMDFSTTLLETGAKMREFLEGAGLLPEEPPTDPKARALWLRQHRNTGPKKVLDRRKLPRR